MAVARINGEMITWALRRSGASLESLSTKTITPVRLKAWEAGEEFPSESDARELADRLGIAYPMLYMQNVPPDEPIKIPDRRTVDARPLVRPSLNLLKVLDYTRARQEWYRSELLSSSSGQLDFVGRFNLRDSPAVIAEDIRKTLNVDRSTRTDADNFESFLTVLVSRAENAGILVMRSALVGHATKKLLDVTEFRGFVLLDMVAPLIFINDNDAKAAQIFTFAHELTHIWIGKDGISDRKPEDRGSSRNDVELICDKIAAEFLVPEKEFLPFWSNSRNLHQNMTEAARHFRVSSLVILRRAHDFRLISSDVFFAKVKEQYERYKRREAAKKSAPKEEEKKKGGNFWASFDLRNGAKFNAAVAESIRNQRTTYAEAGTLFGVTPASAARYMSRLGPG